MEQKNEMMITFDSRSSNESFARVAVAAFTTQLNPTLEEVADIKTAVSEAITNASAASAAYILCAPRSIIPVSPRIIPHFFLIPVLLFSKYYPISGYINLRKKISVHPFFHPSGFSSAWHDGLDCTADSLQSLLLFSHDKP